MSVLSMFCWIVVCMYFYDNKQHRKPNFDVEYAEFSALVSAADCEVFGVSSSTGKMKLVRAWLEIHRDAILAERGWQLKVLHLNVFGGQSGVWK